MTRPLVAPISGAYQLPHPGGAGSFHFARSATHHHQGIDIEAESGRPWLAVSSGVVEHAHAVPARGFAGYGRVVVLRLDSGERVLYAHGASVAVRPGQRVAMGELLGTVGRSQFRGGDPLDENRRMGSHLHFEVSSHAYPQGPEAPTRRDPVAWLAGGGVPSSGDGGPPPPLPPVPPTPPAAPPQQAAKSLRDDLMARVVQTDLDVNQAALALERNPLTSSAAPVVRRSWMQSRGRILSALSSAAPVDVLRARVGDWLNTVREAREQLAMAPTEGLRAMGDAWTAAQHRLWTAGQWMIAAPGRLLDAAEDAVLAPLEAVGVGAGGVLFLVGALWLLSRGRR